MERPVWIESIVGDSDLERIRSAVAQAESRTSGEIVPMIVHRSITTGHVPLILFLVFLLIFWTLVPYIAVSVPQIPLWGFEVGAILLAAFSAWTQKESSFWQRALTPPRDQMLSVLRRAQLEFFESDIKATEGKTGVLIFVSLLERRAVVLADQAVSERFPAETWEDIIKILLEKVRAGDFTGGMCDAIGTVGTLLAEKLPIEVGDRNELSNHLVIKE